jgi:hypothetical protein
MRCVHNLIERTHMYTYTHTPQNRHVCLSIYLGGRRVRQDLVVTRLVNRLCLIFEPRGVCAEPMTQHRGRPRLVQCKPACGSVMSGQSDRGGGGEGGAK